MGNRAEQLKRDEQAVKQAANRIEPPVSERRTESRNGLPLSRVLSSKRSQNETIEQFDEPFGGSSTHRNAYWVHVPKQHKPATES